MSVWKSFVACRRRFPEVHQRAKSNQVNILSNKWNQFFPSVINLTDLAIKRIIKMAKQISAFTRVCQEDQVGLCTHQASFNGHLVLQVSLLKGGCTELMILRSVVNFDSEQNAWQVGDSLYSVTAIFFPLQIPGRSDKRVLSMDVLKVG